MKQAAAGPGRRAVLMASPVTLAALFVLSAFFVWLFLVFDPSFSGPDAPLYFSYAESLVRDCDLNIADNGVPNIKPGEPVPVTATGCFPDYHNHAGAAFWTAAYLWGRAAWNVAAGAGLAAFGEGPALRAALSFFVMCAGFLTILFSFFFARRFSGPAAAAWATIMAVFATPYYFFMAAEPHNGQILASLLALGCVYFVSFLPGMRGRDMFFLGLFFGMCAAVKIDLWFLSVFIFAYWAALRSEGRRTLADWLFFGAGFIPPLALKLANDFVRYGALRQGEFGLLNFRSFYFFEQIFSSYRGFFYTSPVFYLCAAGFVIVCAALTRVRREGGARLEDKFVFCLSLSLLVKLFVLSFRYAWGGGTPGARILLSEFVLFVLLLARLFYWSRGRSAVLRLGLVLSCLAALFWNALVIGEFLTLADVANIEKMPPLAQRLPALATVAGPFFAAKAVGMKLLLLGPPAAIALFALWFFLLRAERQAAPGLSPFGATASALRPPVFLSWAAFLLFASYVLCGGLNIFFGPQNVERLRAEGFYEGCTLIGRAEFENAENIGSIDEMIVFRAMRRDWERVGKLRKLRAYYVGRHNGGGE